MVSQPKTNDIYTFSRFIDRLIAYMAIRGKSHLHEYPGMIKCVETIKGLFAQHRDGILYDCRFRIMRADNPNVRWSCYRAELVVQKPQQMSSIMIKANQTIPRKSLQLPNSLDICFVTFTTLVNAAALWANTHMSEAFCDKNHTKRTCPKKTNNWSLTLITLIASVLMIFADLYIVELSHLHWRTSFVFVRLSIFQALNETSKKERRGRF